MTWQWIRIVSIAWFCGLLALPALAQQRGTADEAVALAEAAVAHLSQVGPQRALEAFNKEAAWRRKDLYVVVIDTHGICRAHGTNPRMLNRSLLELVDEEGRSPVASMLEQARSHGRGWVNYLWADPYTRKITKKHTYVLRTEGFDGLVAVGIYP